MTDKTVVILQSNYLPWRGYFDLMRRADLFIVLDVVQFTKNDWRNRNRIKSSQGPQWLTIPVRYKFSDDPMIDQMEIADNRWANKHIKSIRQNYSKAGAFAAESEWLFGQIEALAGETMLSDVNVTLLRAIATRIGVETPIVQSTEFGERRALIEAEPNDRLIAMLTEAGATRYISGPAAQSYMDMPRFEVAGIAVEWMTYDDYPDYPQLYPPFDGKLSIIDLLLNVGAENALRYLPALR